MRRLLLISVALFALTARPSLAAPIVVFDFGTDLGPSLVAPNLIASVLTPAPGNVNLSVSRTTLDGGELRMAALQVPVTSGAQAVAENQFASITLTASPGWLMDLSSIDLLIARGGTSAPRGFVLRSSVDGFAADLFGGDSAVVRPTYEAAGGALGAGFTNLTSVAFRLYAYGSPTATSAMYFDDITIGGATKPIPEPTILLLLLGGLVARAARASRQ